MSKLITFDKGSKRRLKQVRWRMVEVFSLALLAILTIAIGIVALYWQLKNERHDFQPNKLPQIKESEPRP